MSCPLLKKRGLAKGNINRLISDIKPQVEDDILPDLTLDEYTSKKVALCELRGKLESQTGALKDMEEKFLQMNKILSMTSTTSVWKALVVWQQCWKKQITS